MTVNETLQVSGDGTWAHAHSERPASEPAVDLPFNRRLIFHGPDQRQQFSSVEEVAQALDQEMIGHPWRMSLTYVGGFLVRASLSISTRRARYKGSRASGWQTERASKLGSTSTLCRESTARCAVDRYSSLHEYGASSPFCFRN